MSTALAKRNTDRFRRKLAPNPGWLGAAAQLMLKRLLLLLALLALWEFAADRLVPSFFVSRPTAILATLANQLADGSLLYNAGITASEAILGFTAGAAAGIGTGVALGRSQTLSDLLNPFVMAFYSLPKVALAPLFILWFGIGMEMKVVLTGATVFFLVFINTYTGVRSVSPELITILRLMNASKRQILVKVILPSALTWVFTGLRISVPYALIGAVVGELMASNRGLGAMLAMAQGQFDTAGIFAGLLAITVLSLTLNGAVRLAEKVLTPWTASRGQDGGL